MKLTAQVEVERPGVVKVRARPPSGRENDSRPVCGFYVRRRYADDEFMIGSWADFSPRWMEFVNVEDVPADWLDKIEAREKERERVAADAMIENNLTPTQKMAAQLMSMAQVANGGGEIGEINHSTGKVTTITKKKADRQEI